MTPSSVMRKFQMSKDIFLEYPPDVGDGPTRHDFTSLFFDFLFQKLRNPLRNPCEPSHTMLCDLPFELLCLIVEKIDLNSTITLSQTCKYLRAAVLATPRAITINVQFGKEEETDEEPPPFENISFFVKELHCIKCLHVFQANGQLLKQVCACFCHRMDEKLPSITTMNVELCNEDSACLSNFSPILSSVRKIHLIEAIVSDSDVFEKMTNLEELLITCPEQLTTATLLSIWFDLSFLKYICSFSF